MCFEIAAAAVNDEGAAEAAAAAAVTVWEEEGCWCNVGVAKQKMYKLQVYVASFREAYLRIDQFFLAEDWDLIREPSRDCNAPMKFLHCLLCVSPDRGCCVKQKILQH